MTPETYPFKGVPKPFAHQVATFLFLILTPRCFVFNDIGTGKTWSAVWAAHYLFLTGAITSLIIVAPLSTLNIVWKRTFFHLDAIGIDCEVLQGTAAKRLKLLNRDTGGKFRVSIINPDALHIIQDDPAIKNYQMIIVDESAMFRNAKSRRVKALNVISEGLDRVVMMTGSPFPEAPTDVWATAKIVCPERVSKWFGQFRDLTMRKLNQFKWVALPNAHEIIAQLLAGFVIRFTREQCIDLPPSHHVEVNVEATKQQIEYIKEIKKEAVVMIEDGSISAANEAVVISKILQIAGGAVKFKYEDGLDGVLETDCKPKFDAFEEILEASTQPIILFAPFTAVIDRIEKWLIDKKIPYGRIDGSVDPTKRLHIFDQLQSGMIRVLLAHPQAMSHGITLTTSNIVCWWVPLFSHEIFEQANGRVVRPGQTRETYFVHLACSALESRVLKRLKTKSHLQGVLLDYLQREGT